VRCLFFGAGHLGAHSEVNEGPKDMNKAKSLKKTAERMFPDEDD